MSLSSGPLRLPASRWSAAVVRCAVLITTVIAVLLSPQPASAHYLWHEDADDSRGSLDLQGVRFFRRSEPSRGVLRARTYEDIDYGQALTMMLTIDSRGRRRADREIHLTFDGASYGWLCSISNLKTDEDIGDCTFGHSERLWRITFPWKVLNATRHIRWKVLSQASGVEDPYDYAPDAGWFEH